VTPRALAPKIAPAPAEAVQRISILGSTGSIGRNTLDIVARNRERFVVEALTAHRDVQRLIEQSLSHRPRVAVIGDAGLYAQLRERLAGSGVEAAAGPEAVLEAAGRPVDWVMAGIVGAAGLAPTLAAVRNGVRVALANKECLVCAGELFTNEVRASGATLIPVDSEHNAIFQVFDFAHPEAVDRIILTASGGPFRTWSRNEMGHATVEQAIAHPNWSMGAKISVDSATLMNKGLELIEACYLFPVPHESIEIIIHPQSVIHSMVAYADGSVLAQLGVPDMRTPIAFALAWPKRMASPVARLDLAQIAKLTFEPPDESRFPSLRLARRALQCGGGAPTILNAANEVAVCRFLERRLGFLDIPTVVEATLDKLWGKGAPRPASLAEVHALDREARALAEELADQAKL
jgi:1-deoxy-D-xylulose-5-phosphate reductoisomerase